MNILFICLGNICRSPLAEEVFRQKVKTAGRTADFPLIDSAGMIDYHEGELPDHRMRQQAAAQGYALTHHSRPMTAEDFHTFGCRQSTPFARKVPRTWVDEQGGVALWFLDPTSRFLFHSRPLLWHFGWFRFGHRTLRRCLHRVASTMVESHRRRARFFTLLSSIGH